MLEKEIQSKIKKELTKRGYKVRRAVANTESGWPDLDVYKDGRVVFGEVKRPGEKLTKLQEFRKKELESIGFIVLVLNTVNDCDRVELAFKNY